MGGGIVQRLAEGVAVGLFPVDQVVGRSDRHHGLGIALQQRVGRVGDAGGRVASVRLEEEVLRPELRDVAQDGVLVTGQGHDQDVFRRDDAQHALVSVAEEGLAEPFDGEELLRAVLAAEGPEHRAPAACHDDAVIM